MLFCFFIKIIPRTSKFINYLSLSALSAYLIHDGILVRWIWDVVFKTNTHANSAFLIFHILFAAFAIYLAGIILDIARRFIWDYILKVFDSIRQRIKTA